MSLHHPHGVAPVRDVTPSHGDWGSRDGRPTRTRHTGAPDSAVPGGPPPTGGRIVRERVDHGDGVDRPSVGEVFRQ